MPEPRRRELAEKLTATARKIAWLDPQDQRMPEASRAQIEALEAKLVSLRSVVGAACTGMQWRKPCRRTVLPVVTFV